MGFGARVLLRDEALHHDAATLVRAVEAQCDAEQSSRLRLGEQVRLRVSTCDQDALGFVVVHIRARMGEDELGLVWERTGSSLAAVLDPVAAAAKHLGWSLHGACYG